MHSRATRFFWTLLAAIFLVEAWLWDVLGAAIGALVARLPIEALRRHLRRLIDTMPAAFALTLFILPILVILPFKLVALALIGKGRVFLGATVFLLAKTAGVGVTAFVFDVCRDRLMALAWFARFYVKVVAFRDWAHARIQPYRDGLRASLTRFRVRISELLAADAPSLTQKIAAFRARIRTRSRKTS